MGERRHQDLARVVRRPADLRDVPVRAEVGGAHLAGRPRSRRPRGRPRRPRVRRAPSASRTTTPHRPRRRRTRSVTASWRSRSRSARPPSRCCAMSPSPPSTVPTARPPQKRWAAVDLVGLALVHEPEPQARRSCSQRTAAPRVAHQDPVASRRRRGRASRDACRRGSRPRCTGSRSVRAARSSSMPSRISRRSSTPPWARRMAPAVNAELPPDHSGSAFSSTTTSHPRSRAACAADMPALPGADDDDPGPLLVHHRHAPTRHAVLRAVSAERPRCMGRDGCGW